MSQSKYPKNYEWHLIPDDADVELVGKPGAQAYAVNGDGLAMWSGHFWMQAQSRLDKLVKKTAERKRLAAQAA